MFSSRLSALYQYISCATAEKGGLVTLILSRPQPHKQFIASLNGHSNTNNNFLWVYSDGGGKWQRPPQPTDGREFRFHLRTDHLVGEQVGERDGCWDALPNHKTCV